MSADLLDKILEAARVGETTDWEFKSAKGGFPGSFWETYSAMANSEGGIILLGVREKDGEVHLDGLTPEQATKHQKYFWDNVHNRNTVSANLLTSQDVSIVELDGPVLLAIQVPRATSNKSLQKMFALIGRGEQAGSGADKIRTGWRLNRWRAPKLECHDRPSRVELVLPMVSLIPEETLTHLRAMLGVAIDSLTPSELQALATAELENAVSNIRLQELLPDHSVEISRMLARLCERGLLVSDNRRRWATYRLGTDDKVPSFFDQTDSSHKDKDSIHLQGDSIHLQGDSIHLQGDSIRLSELSQQNPDELEKELKQLAFTVATKGKAPAEEIRSVIIQLCKGRHLTVGSLACYLNRNPVALRSRFLKPMVRQGVLSLRYPNAPNRPDQAYTASEDFQ